MNYMINGCLGRKIKKLKKIKSHFVLYENKSATTEARTYF